MSRYAEVRLIRSTSAASLTVKNSGRSSRAIYTSTPMGNVTYRPPLLVKGHLEDSNPRASDHGEKTSLT